jgi:hypothetical protein
MDTVAFTAIAAATVIAAATGTDVPVMATDAPVTDMAAAMAERTRCEADLPAATTVTRAAADSVAAGEEVASTAAVVVADSMAVVVATAVEDTGNSSGVD